MEVNFPPCKEIMTDRTKRPTGAADGQDRRLGKFDFQLGKQKNNNCVPQAEELAGGRFDQACFSVVAFLIDEAPL